MEHVRTIENALHSCSSLLKKAMGVLQDEQRANAEQLQGELDWIINTKIQPIRQRISQLGLRFNRRTFNIGVTGNAGTGKSQLLQSLTGLPNDLIPARENLIMSGMCTGAPSIIVNNADSDRVCADVEFYQETDFFEEIIKPYYWALDPEQRWLPSPSNFYEFSNCPFPSLPEEYSRNTRIRNLYDLLRLLRNSVNQYQRDFGRRLSNVENPDEIRRYVAQKDKNNRPIMDWIPVKKMMICCPFKGRDGKRITDQISVCDTPGLGDIECKADNNLMRNIAKHVDVIWMLNLLIPTHISVKQNETDLYALIADAVPEWTPQDWVYGVINRYTNVNNQHVEVFRQELKKRHIDVRNVYDLDARKPEEVLAVFHSTLDDIVENQKTLDEKLYNARYDQVKQLFDEIAHLVVFYVELLPEQCVEIASIIRSLDSYGGENIENKNKTMMVSPKAAIAIDSLNPPLIQAANAANPDLVPQKDTRKAASANDPKVTKQPAMEEKPKEKTPPTRNSGEEFEGRKMAAVKYAIENPGIPKNYIESKYNLPQKTLSREPLKSLIKKGRETTIKPKKAVSEEEKIEFHQENKPADTKRKRRTPLTKEEIESKKLDKLADDFLQQAENVKNFTKKSGKVR